MNEKKSARIFLVLLVGLLLINSFGGVIAPSDKDSDNNGLDAYSNPIVSGASTVGGGLEQVYNVIKPGLESLVGNTGKSEDFFAKLMLMLILFGIVYEVMEKSNFFDNKWVLYLISILVPILAIRFLKSDWVNAILLPYSAFGIAVASLIPLMIYFVFVEGAFNSKTFRKIAWIFAAVVFIGLFFSRAQETNIGNAIWIYPVSAIACLIFMLADKSIQRAWTKAQVDAVAELRMARARSALIERRRMLEEGRLNGSVIPRDYVTENKDLVDLEKKYGIK